MRYTLYRYQLPFSSPLIMKGQSYAHREGLIVEIAGKGWGEIAPLPHWSKETLDEAEREAKKCLLSSCEKKPQLSSVSFGITSALLPQSFSKSIPLAALLWGKAEEVPALAKKAVKENN